MRLGVHLGGWGGRSAATQAAVVAEADRLGLDSVWLGEAWGADALTPLAWWGASTERVRLGTGIVQMSARQPTATAMAAMSLGHLSGGRFVLGLGISGPQVVEGWYGRDFTSPLQWTREYVAVIREVVARERPVSFDGERYRLPFPGGTGLGKPLKIGMPPLAAELPIYLAAEGPKNVALAAELCDGWLALFYAPRHDEHHRRALAEGFARPGARSTPERFEVAATLPVIVTDDRARALDALRPWYARYFGGMGAAKMNFHADAAARMGFGRAVRAVEERWAAGDHAGAAAAVPTELIDEVALVGCVARLRHDLEMWRESVVDVVLVERADVATLGVIAELFG